MTTFPGDTHRTCGCCGATLPDGRLYTCNDRCEAAQNGRIDEYVKAASLSRYGFEHPRGEYPTPGHVPGDGGRSASFDVHAYHARVFAMVSALCDRRLK